MKTSKRILSLLLALLMIVSLMPMAALADSSVSDDIYYSVDAETKTLCLANAAADFTGPTPTKLEDKSTCAWSDIETVKVLSDIAPVDMSGWFKGIKSIEGIDKLKTANVTNMSGLFEDAALTSLDLSSWTVSEGCDVTDMLSGCTELREIKAPAVLNADITLPEIADHGWVTDSNTTSTVMAHGSSYQLMKLDSNGQPYYELTYKGTANKTVKKINFNTTDNAYTATLRKEFTPDSPDYVLRGWRDGEGTLYKLGQKLTLNGDMTLYPVWGPTVTDKEGKPAEEGQDYTLENGVLTLKKISSAYTVFWTGRSSDRVRT